MIVVTGATGFIGKRLVQKLIDKGENIMCVVRKNIALEKNIPNLEFFYSDLNSPKLEKALKGADAIIHLAAAVSSDRKKANRANIEGMKNILEAAKKNNVKRFVFLSSELAKYPEESYYGKTKLFGEKMLKESGLNFVILRPSIVFGPGDSKNLSALIRKIRSLPFAFVIGKGAYRFHPVFVDDLADAIIASVQKKEALGKTFEIGGPGLSFREIVETILDEFQWKKRIIGLPKGLLLAIAFFTEKIPGIGLSRKRINSVSIDRPMNTRPAEQLLGFKPVSFRKSLILTMKGENWS